MDVLLAMRTFRRVVERNSFYKAAEDLLMTPAALSKKIKQLEARLGTELITRTTRTMSLTEAGQLYYQEACRLLGEVDTLEQNISDHRLSVKGTLRINAPLSFGLVVLSPLLPVFMQRHPQLQVELTLSDEVLDIVAAGFDISLRIRRQLPDSSLSARTIGNVWQRICAAPSYLARCGTPLGIEDLRHHDCLAYSLAEKPGQWDFFTDEETSMVALKPRLLANNSLMLRDMVGAGLGIASLPSFVADPWIANGQLVELFPQLAAGAFQVFAVHTTRQHLQHKVRLFIDFLQAEIQRPALLAAGPQEARS